MSAVLVAKQLKGLGFKVSPKSKTKILSLTYRSGNARGYISIRHDPVRDLSAVIAEFYGSTKSKGEGIGGSFYLVRIVPKNNNVTFYKGLNSKKCEADFVKVAKYMARAVAVYQAASKF